MKAAIAPAVLLVDDDDGTRVTFGSLLSRSGYRVKTANSGAEAIAASAAAQFDLMVIDWRLPDMVGGDVVTQVRSRGHRTPFIVISGFLTTKVTVDVMKMGAFDVIEKPLSLEGFVDAVESALAPPVSPHDRPAQDAKRGVAIGLNMEAAKLRSSADRWAFLVLSACHSEADPRTLADWSRFVGVSYTSLRELCRVARVVPHEGRDLMRMLRALIQANGEIARVQSFLNISDERTLKELLRRASFQHKSTVSVPDFFAHQQLIDADCDGMVALEEMYTAAKR